MPTSLLDADLKFANIGKKKELPQRVEDMESYLYQLLEQLRYSFGNLDRSNFNDAGFSEIAGIINQPIIAEIKGIDGQLTEITATSAALTTRVEDAEGNITALYQFADEITQKVEDAEGNITTLTATAQGLNTRVTDAEGSISTLTQTATSLSSKVSSVEGSVSTLTQTVNSISLGVSNGEESSTIKLYRNGVAVSSQNIQFTGMVKFSDLSGSGTTVINGNNITTGEIRAINFVARGEEGQDIHNVFSVENSYGDTIGEIGYQWVNADNANGDKLWLRTLEYYKYGGNYYPSIKIESIGRISIESNNAYSALVYLRSARQMTLDAEQINIYDDVGTEWTFIGGSLLKNGVEVL